MLITSHMTAMCFYAIEGTLAWLAFGSLQNTCVQPQDWHHTHPSTTFIAEFPCKTAPLFNQNFLDLQGFGQIINFFPMLNMATVPVNIITLRNNLL
jgi:hypothetical protein